MPHAFNPHPDHPAVDYLVRLHADLDGRIQANKTEAERLAGDMKAVEAVIKMFNPAFNCRAISARRKQAKNPWFKRDTMFRAAVDVLRTASTPLTVREITLAVMAAHKIEATAENRRTLEGGLRGSLEHNAGKMVQSVGEGMPKRWQLI